MPKVVDHQARRAEVAAVAADLIARRGLDVSVRDVAAAGGYSTTVVTHYFASKRELLLHAYRSAGFATEERLAAKRGLFGICEAILPLDEPRRRTWQTWFAFWGAAVADEELAALQRRRLLWFRDLLARSSAATRTRRASCSCSSAGSPRRPSSTPRTGHRNASASSRYVRSTG